LRRQAPVAAAFIERRPQGGHRIIVHEPFELPDTGDRLEDVRQLTAAFNRAIEEQIRRRPEEWVWWHERWRRAPIPRLDLDA
jgi:KDO2-lipid IV(A) lauroyltransferase